MSMMERNNRKSYLEPPAPRALNRDGSRDSFISPAPDHRPTSNSVSYANSYNHHPPSTAPNSGSSGDTQSIRTTSTPTSQSGEIPVIATQSPPPNSFTTGMSPRSPTPPLSLEHLSLETQDKSMLNSHPARGNRLHLGNRDSIPEPASAVEPTTRPFFPPRMHSASALSAGSGFSARNGLQSATMPRRTAPPATGPPTGPLPATPGKEARSTDFGSPRRPR